MSDQLNLFDSLSLYEGVDVEYKSAKGGLPASLWETYSAFANTLGGTIWLGVAQVDGELDIQGVDNPEKMLADFWNAINNRAKTNLNILSNSDVAIVLVPEKAVRVIRIQVPRADRRQRPIFLGSDPFRGTYRRNHEGDYRCSESEVRRMFADQSEEPTDSRILPGFGLEDIHQDSLNQFRNVFMARTPHVWQSEDDKGLLEKLGGWRKDRSSGTEGLTLAGLLMFGKDQAIRDPLAVPGFQLDYRERFSADPAIRWTDRLTLDGTWEGNLFQFYQRVMLKLSTGPGIKKPFQTNAEGYRVAKTPVTEALQEALVNALIHADYFGQGGIVIDRWVDRLEFSNPGTLLISRAQLQQGGISECRNRSLQVMFQMLGAGDKAGSGIDKIRAGWKSENWQSPSLRETMQPDRVKLVLPMISILPAETLSQLESRFGNRFKELEPDEVHTLVAASLEGEITNQRLQEMLDIHRVDITRLLRSLVQRGFLQSEGVRRGTRYRVSESEAALKTGAPTLKTGAPSLKTGAPPLKTGAPPLSETEGVSISADSPLWMIAAHIRESQRTDPEKIREVILELCRHQDLTVQQLAELLNRESESLQRHYLKPLMQTKLLELKYPEKPNHPQQAYRTRVQTS